MLVKPLLCLLLKFFKIRLNNKSGLVIMKLTGILRNISTILANNIEQKRRWGYKLLRKNFELFLKKNRKNSNTLVPRLNALFGGASLFFGVY